MPKSCGACCLWTRHILSRYQWVEWWMERSREFFVHIGALSAYSTCTYPDRWIRPQILQSIQLPADDLPRTSRQRLKSTNVLWSLMWSVRGVSMAHQSVTCCSILGNLPNWCIVLGSGDGQWRDVWRLSLSQINWVLHDVRECSYSPAYWWLSFRSCVVKPATSNYGCHVRQKALDCQEDSRLLVILDLLLSDSVQPCVNNHVSHVWSTVQLFMRT
jgi:hypothetical protein